jgi:phenylacetate-CoA ligase
MRVFAASARGYYLKGWRYSKDTDRLVAEALEREQWSQAEWEEWQQERLAHLLRRASTSVPFYRQQWSDRRKKGDRASPEYLENWPILVKEDLRADPHAFIADDCDYRKMYADHTSGTTGKPLTIYLSRETVRAWYALFEARVRVWNGLSRNDRWAILGGQMIAAPNRRRPPFWVWNAGLNQLYLSVYHLGPEHIEDYLEAMRRHGVIYILGYASSLNVMANLAIEQGLEPPNLALAISNAEPLNSSQRETIARAFRSDIRDTYGAVELTCAASECHSGVMHIWPEAGIIEIMQDQAAELAEPGSIGRMICTGLLNTDMPLIRYEIGDRGALDASTGQCLCGRTLPRLQRIEGRMADVVVTRDGRRIWGLLGPTFGGLHVKEGQLVQEDFDQIRVRFVPASGFAEAEGIAIVERLRFRLGDVSVELEPVERIPRSANGKFQAVISRVSLPVS